MWYPNRRQWLVIWIAAPLTWLAWALPGTESFEEVVTDLWSLLALVGALLVWRFADRPAAPLPGTRAPKPRETQSGGNRLLGWLLVIGLLGAILLRINAVQSAVRDLLQPSDLSDVQTTLQDISDKLDR